MEGSGSVQITYDRDPKAQKHTQSEHCLKERQVVVPPVMAGAVFRAVAGRGTDVGTANSGKIYPHQMNINCCCCSPILFVSASWRGSLKAIAAYLFLILGLNKSFSSRSIRSPQVKYGRAEEKKWLAASWSLVNIYVWATVCENTNSRVLCFWNFLRS
jgi:hypothetical protein